MLIQNTYSILFYAHFPMVQDAAYDLAVPMASLPRVIIERQELLVGHMLVVWHRLI